MKEFIIENLTAASYTSLGSTVFKLIMAMVIGSAAYVAYYLTSSKVCYNRSFNFSLVAMSIITTAVMAVISSNLALSLGMVGALSIIRFRTAIKDSRDTMFIFWSIMVGICCGVSQFMIALVATAVLFLFFLLAKTGKEDQRYILIIRCQMPVAEQVKALVYRQFPSSRLSVQNTAQENAEFIFELKRFQDQGTDNFLQEIYALDGIECANFVLQEDKAGV